MSCNIVFNPFFSNPSIGKSTKPPKILSTWGSYVRIFYSSSAPDYSVATEISGNNVSLTGGAYDFEKATTSLTQKLLSSPKKVWYQLSKALARRLLGNSPNENGLDIVVINPGTVMDQMIPPVLNASMQMLLRLLQGCTDEYKDFYMGSVHVKDVALTYILVYENTSATGRHICLESITHYSDFARAGWTDFWSWKLQAYALF